MVVDGERPIRIVRDRHGVPHVCASTEADLYRGLGYCHGRDRSLQLLLLRIIGEGRASEVLSAAGAMLELDLFFRRLHPGGGAAAEVAKLLPGERRLLDAYCAGVNAALARRTVWELRMLGYRPAPWMPTDCILLSRVTGYVSLAQSQGEMERFLVELIQQGVPRQHLAALFPHLADEGDVELLRRVRLGARMVPEALRWSPAVPRAVASNNWVIGGAKTASGRPLLANDPHLEVNRLPAVWYEVVLELDGRYCIAATMPGLPAAVLGRTNDLAWGATYAFMDAVDSWIEDCCEGRYRRVTRDGDVWEPFRVRRELIRRRGKTAVTATFHENAHGVLDGDPTVPGLYLATRWAAGSGTGAVSIGAAMGMLHALNVTEGMELLGRVETAWNFVLADRHGNVGYQMSGSLPRRRAGASGLVPLPGWDAANDWQGLVPPGELPRAYNPPSGFIVTANDDLNHLGEAKPINLPMGAYRAERIAALLAARDDWDVAGSQAVQMDVLSTQAERFMAVLRPLLPATPAADVLREWDLRYDLDARGPCLFEAFYRELVIEVFGPLCGHDVIRFVVDETPILVDFYANFDAVLLDAGSVWYGEEGRDAVFRRVAARALGGLVATWGERRQIRLTHLLLGGRLPRWLGFDYGPIPLRGGRATVHQGQIYRSGGRLTTFAPSYRLVTDLADASAWTTLAGGPSDRRFSRWYTSEIDAWLAGRFKCLQPLGASSSAS
jgi:penicillin amidase